MADILYDLPISFYQQACVTDGEFDAEKAAALGYSPAQFGAIKEALGLSDPPESEEDLTPVFNDHVIGI